MVHEVVPGLGNPSYRVINSASILSPSLLLVCVITSLLVGVIMLSGYENVTGFYASSSYALYDNSDGCGDDKCTKGTEAAYALERFGNARDTFSQSNVRSSQCM